MSDLPSSTAAAAVTVASSGTVPPSLPSIPPSTALSNPSPPSSSSSISNTSLLPSGRGRCSNDDDDDNDVVGAIPPPTTQPSCSGCEEEGIPAVFYCEDCGNVDLCSSCSLITHKLKMNRNHIIVPISEKPLRLLEKARLESVESKSRGHRCKVHPDQIQYYYCEDHLLTVCPACCLIGGKHYQCKITLLQDAVVKVKEEQAVELKKLLGGGGGGEGEDEGGGSTPSIISHYMKLTSIFKEQLNGMCVHTLYPELKESNERARASQKRERERERDPARARTNA